MCWHILNIAGPKVWTKIALKRQGQQQAIASTHEEPAAVTTTPTSATTTILPSETFFPCLVEDRKHCNEYLPKYKSRGGDSSNSNSNMFGMHSWDMSWS